VREAIVGIGLAWVPEHEVRLPHVIRGDLVLGCGKARAECAHHSRLFVLVPSLAQPAPERERLTYGDA
jgi:hypothetical protein